MSKEWEDIIDRYIRYELSKEEYIRFEELMNSEPDFAKQVKLAEHISISIERLNEEKALKEMLDLADEEKITLKPPMHAASKHKAPYVKHFISFSAVAVVILLLLYIGFGPKYSSEQLFEEHYAALPYEEIPSRGDYIFTNKQAKDIEKAFLLYDNKKYQEASDSFNKAINQINIEEIPENVTFYAAISEIEIQQIANAKTKLKYLSENGELFLYDAKWYLALIYLQEKNRKESLNLLIELAEVENLYQNNSIELIAQLQTRKWF